MIETHWTLFCFFLFVAVLVGVFLMALFTSTKRREEAWTLEEAKEEIIQAAIDHAEVVDSRSFYDYDIDINKEGEKKILDILEGL